jgi:hypothetical protein
MKTVRLRELLREPLKIKRWTRAGQSVQINDNGKSLWVIRAASDLDTDDEARCKARDELLDEVLKGPSILHEFVENHQGVSQVRLT